MKVLLLDDCYKYLYPDGVKDLDGFIGFLKKQKEVFIPMEKLDDESSVDPYYIEGEEKQVHINFSQIGSIEESDASVISAEEYDRRMAPVIRTMCPECMFEGDPDMKCDSVENKRDKIDIDINGCALFESGDGGYDPEDPDDDPDNKGKIYFLNKEKN
ncbi:MAG: hypothetical protein VB031_04810 [Eubacteriaceae bacterium]|nr:hypothetical protein [Eubacteriaceae bacterium]